MYKVQLHNMNLNCELMSRSEHETKQDILVKFSTKLTMLHSLKTQKLMHSHNCDEQK